MPIADRFQEPRVRLDTVRGHRLVGGDRDLAKEICAAAEVVSFNPGERLIEQGADDRDLYLIVAGSCDVVVNGRKVAIRGPGDHVGEMAALQPAQRRSASVVARDEVVALKLAEPQLEDLGNRFPAIYRTIAQELARRLLQRNAHIGDYRQQIRVFIISSAEALEIAKLVQEALERDFLVEVWSDGVFKIASYTLTDLERKVDQADFAIAIAHADDVTSSRGQQWPAPRDNVIFELGLFMGRLGLDRAILMEPREEKVKLPSDYAGLQTVAYVWEKGPDAAARLAPACNRLRRHMLELGPNNG
jgi:predicted nucleotide-binding protein